MPTPEQIDTIRRLNDAARTHPGLASLANVTMGFQALPELDRFAALVAITVPTVEWLEKLLTSPCATTAPVALSVRA